jgi:hypothetical protein
VGNVFDDVLRNIGKSKTSDRQMSNIWLLFYFFPIISSVMFIGFTIFSVLSVASTNFPFISPDEYSNTEFFSEFTYILILFLIALLTVFLVNLVLTYELVKRRNLHFARQNLLFNSLILDFKSYAENNGLKEENNLLTANRILNEAKVRENRKDPVLWAVLSAFLPFVSWFVNYFLMKDFYNHERREEIFWGNLSNILHNFGMNFSVPSRNEVIPNRSFGLNLILTIITVGLFGIYWVQILLRDPNEHFKYHIEIENSLKNTLISIST